MSYINDSEILLEMQGEFNLAKALIYEQYRQLPKVVIDKNQCHLLLSSVHISRDVSINSDHLSAALFLMCRRDWMKIWRNKKGTFSDPETGG